MNRAGQGRLGHGAFLGSPMMAKAVADESEEAPELCLCPVTAVGSIVSTAVTGQYHRPRRVVVGSPRRIAEQNPSRLSSTGLAGRILVTGHATQCSLPRATI